MLVIVFGILGIAVLAAVAALIGASSGRSSAERRTAVDVEPFTRVDGPFGGGARARGTMQPLHAEDIDDVIVLDGYIVVDTGRTPALLQGPATLALRQATSTSGGPAAAHLRLLDVRGDRSTIQFDVASVR